MFEVISVFVLAVIFLFMYKSHHFFKAIFYTALQGISALFCVNFIGGFIGVHIPVNLFSGLLAVSGGLPGVIFTVVLQTLYDIIH